MLVTYNVTFPTLVTVERENVTAPLTTEECNAIALTAWRQLCEVMQRDGLSCLIVDYSRVDASGQNRTQYGEVLRGAL